MENINSIIKNLKQHKKVFIIGAAIVDIIIQLDKLPLSGEDVTAKPSIQSVGGCAFNVADVLDKLNLKFDLMIPIGNGDIANIVKREMLRKNYYINHIKDDIDNGYCLSIVENTGERTFITMPGIETKMKKSFLKKYNINDYDYIYISGYEAEGENGSILLNILKKKKSSARVIFDTGPRTSFIDKNIMKELLKQNTILTINKQEIIEIAQNDNIIEAGKQLNSLTREPVIITLGKDGAILVNEKNDIEIISGFKVSVKDTIGAGDAHTGGVIAGLICNLQLKESIYLANKISSFVVSKQGAATAPSIDELI